MKSKFLVIIWIFTVLTISIILQIESKKLQKGKTIATAEQGYPVPSLTASLGIGAKGPLLLQDLNYQDHLAAFTHERIPERVVHAKAAGARGYFIATNPMISKYTKADLFKMGKKTPVTVRLSTVAGEAGSADTVQDLRGFAVKFYTQEGNYDLLMLNTKVFNLRDPILFPSVTRSRKRNPSTHLFDKNMYWDFASLRPEDTFSTFLTFTDFGFFKSYRMMSGFAINTFKWTGGSMNQPVFVKYHMLPNTKVEVFSLKQYIKIAGTNPDYQLKDLYDYIAKKRYPTYTLKVQIMTMEQAKKAKFNPFDATKLFPEEDYPLYTVGKMVLNENPKDYFNEIEQVAFQPGNLVPGIEPSPDRVLHGRIFAYGHTQRHRLGSNFNQLPINSPIIPKSKINTYRRDGFMNIYGNGKGGPNFFPNTFNGPTVDPKAKYLAFEVEAGLADRVDTGNEDNYSQLDHYWKTQMKPGEKKRTINAIAYYLSEASKRLQRQTLKRCFDPVNSELSSMLRKKLKMYNKSKKPGQNQIGRRKQSVKRKQSKKLLKV